MTKRQSYEMRFAIVLHNMRRHIQIKIHCDEDKGSRHSYLRIKYRGVGW
jgi:hypothetical protein